MKIPLTSVTSYSYTNSLFQITRIIGIFPSSSDASAHFHIETPSMYSARAHLRAPMTRKSCAVGMRNAAQHKLIFEPREARERAIANMVRAKRRYPVWFREVPKTKRSKMAGTAGKLGSSRLVRSSSRQKSREYRDSSDSDDDEAFDGEKLKTRLMSMWNNMRHGGLKGCKSKLC